MENQSRKLAGKNVKTICSDPDVLAFGNHFKSARSVLDVGLALQKHSAFERMSEAMQSKFKSDFAEAEKSYRISLPFVLCNGGLDSVVEDSGTPRAESDDRDLSGR